MKRILAYALLILMLPGVIGAFLVVAIIDYVNNFLGEG